MLTKLSSSCNTGLVDDCISWAKYPQLFSFERYFGLVSLCLAELFPGLTVVKFICLVFLLQETISRFCRKFTCNSLCCNTLASMYTVKCRQTSEIYMGGMHQRRLTLILKLSIFFSSKPLNLLD